jgi:hypothetical protein
MITVYIWTMKEGDTGHASMKIIRANGTKYYSWWPAGAAGLLAPRGRADASSSGAGHPRRNPVSYGASGVVALAPGEEARGIQNAPYHPGGAYAYNRSDKSMEGDVSADLKFYFRPSSGLSADRAEVVWANRMNKSKGKGAYNLLTNSCCHVVLEALQASLNTTKIQAKIMFGPKTPETVEALCLEVAAKLNNDLLLHSDDLPPVIMARGKGEGNRFVDPSDPERVLNFPKGLHRAPHP